MSAVNRGLGRGLEAILGDITEIDQLRKPVGYQDKSSASSINRPSADVLRVPLSQIEPNPFQPRISFDREELEGLASSIKSLGLISPITVRRLGPEHYQISGGEGR